MGDLLQRLRKASENVPLARSYGSPICREAADHIESLESELTALRKKNERLRQQRDTLDSRAATLFHVISHGDKEHQAWLASTIANHFAGKTVERPRGKGNRERAEKAEAKVAELCEKIIEAWEALPRNKQYRPINEIRQAVADTEPEREI